MSASFTAFALGNLVVPAENGALSNLGYDIEALGLKALGIVIEAKKNKALVNFPELNITTWVPHDEMADVEWEALKGSAEFAALLPNFDAGERPSEIVFWVWKLCTLLSVKFVLGLESGDLIEVWDQEDQPLDFYYKGPVDTPALYLGLGIEEFFPQKWSEIEKFLGERLLFSRFLPSGMYKLEVSLYLKR